MYNFSIFQLFSFEISDFPHGLASLTAAKFSIQFGNNAVISLFISAERLCPQHCWNSSKSIFHSHTAVTFKNNVRQTSRLKEMKRETAQRRTREKYSSFLLRYQMVTRQANTRWIGEKSSSPSYSYLTPEMEACMRKKIAAIVLWLVKQRQMNRTKLGAFVLGRPGSATNRWP